MYEGIPLISLDFTYFFLKEYLCSIMEEYVGIDVGLIWMSAFVCLNNILFFSNTNKYVKMLLLLLDLV